MSRLSNFFGKPKEIELERVDESGKHTEKFTLHPLKGKHMHLFMKEDATPEEQERMAHEIVFQSLLPSEPDATLEEVRELPVEVLNKLLLAAMDVNGMGEDEQVRSIKEKIISQRSQKG